jgi:Fur family transcriptional regulator, ferric uptake regulator
MNTRSRRRATKQQAAIVRALAESRGFRTAQELHDDLRGAGHQVGLTTVYRTLQNLADDGVVDVLVTDAGEAIYRRCDTDDHHHHLVCRGCGHSVEIGSDAVEEWAASTASEHGFSNVTHSAEVFGFCRGCAS